MQEARRTSQSTSQHPTAQAATTMWKTPTICSTLGAGSHKSQASLNIYHPARKTKLAKPTTRRAFLMRAALRLSQEAVRSICKKERRCSSVSATLAMSSSSSSSSSTSPALETPAALRYGGCRLRNVTKDVAEVFGETNLARPFGMSPVSSRRQKCLFAPRDKRTSEAQESRIYLYLSVSSEAEFEYLEYLDSMPRHADSTAARMVGVACPLQPLTQGECVVALRLAEVKSEWETRSWGAVEDWAPQEHRTLPLDTGCVLVLRRVGLEDPKSRPRHRTCPWPRQC